MWESLSSVLNAHQLAFVEKSVNAITALFTEQLPFKRIIASIMFFIELHSMIFFGTPMTPTGPELDLTGYELVFCDEFEGNALDTEAWFTRGNGPRRGGFNASSQAKVHDGNLYLTGEYLADGEYGEGWYAGAVALNQKYKEGYFEISCICSSGGGFWSAFWLQADAPYTPEISQGGVGGAEIDIFEAMDYNKLLSRNAVSHAIHCSGMKGDTSGELNSKRLGSFYGNNIHKEYNTYGLKWTEEEYIFYVNGIESVRSTWADGVSTVPEQLIVSLEIPNELNDKVFEDKNYKTEFIVDYVKIYQTK